MDSVSNREFQMIPVIDWVVWTTELEAHFSANRSKKSEKLFNGACIRKSPLKFSHL
jgi:hypothetical protein